MRRSMETSNLAHPLNFRAGVKLAPEVKRGRGRPRDSRRDAGATSLRGDCRWRKASAILALFW